MIATPRVTRRRFLLSGIGLAAVARGARLVCGAAPIRLVDPEVLRAAVRRLFERTGWRGFIATSPAATLYLSGANIITAREIPDRLAIVFWPRDGEPALLVATVEASQARHDGWMADVRTYVEFARSPIDLLAETMKEKGVPSGKVGIETHHLVAHYSDELGRALPEVSWASGDVELERLRMIKTPQEVSLYRGAALATDRAIRTAFERARPGMTEKQIANIMAAALLENGADEVAFMVLAIGPNTVDTHHIPGDYVARPGDVVHVDFGGRFSGYLTDVSRTATVGPPTADQRRWYGYMWEGVGALIEAIRPGVTVKQLYRIYQDTFARFKLPTNRTLVGHSLGLLVHEYPIFTAVTDQALEPDMIVSIELAENAGAGERYHVEDLVHVTGSGHQILSRSAPWQDLFSIA